MNYPDPRIHVPVGDGGAPMYLPRGWESEFIGLLNDLEDVVPGYLVADVREKWGAMNVRVDLPEDATDDDRVAARRLLSAAHDQSIYTCEVCGLPGQAFDDGEIAWPARCQAHADRQQEAPAAELVEDHSGIFAPRRDGL